MQTILKLALGWKSQQLPRIAHLNLKVFHSVIHLLWISNAQCCLVGYGHNTSTGINNLLIFHVSQPFHEGF